MRASIVFALLLACLGFPGSHPLATSKADTLARSFLDSLKPEILKQAQLTYDDDYRTNWNFVPLKRGGASLAMLSPDQLEKATALLRSCLSEIGYRKVERIRNLEDVLFELEGKNPTRDKTAYIFVVFGEPKSTGTWGWRYEGHHLSLNFAYHDDVLISSTPQFLGTNPADVQAGPMKGRVLAREHELAFALLDSLDEAQRAQAVVGKTEPGEIVTSNKRKVAILEKAGISFADLRPAQRKALMDLIKVHAEVQSLPEQNRRMKRVESESLVFAWMGATKPGSGHYYRIQGSKFLIEYDNSQNNANHVHSVWRDFDGDFGSDVLAEHYAEGPHHHKDHRH